MNALTYLLAFLMGLGGGPIPPARRIPQSAQPIIQTGGNTHTTQRRGDPERTKTGGGPIVVVEDTHFKIGN